MPDADALPIIKRALDQFAARRDLYALYAAYYDGNHRLAFATEKWRSAFGNIFRPFDDNLCPAVVDALVDRLTITGFAPEGKNKRANKSVGSKVEAHWTRNRMDRLAGQVHLEAARAGDAYLIVWPDAAGLPAFYPNRASQVTVRYDEETLGGILWAAKLWTQDDGRVRLTLYHPDRLEKYITERKAEGQGVRAESFVEHRPDGEAWPLLHEWGRVPVFHFGNNAGVGEFGRSELADVVPLQDALNKSFMDKMIASEFGSFRQRWAVGLEVDIDEATGKPRIPFEAGADRLWVSGDEATKFGEFGVTDIRQMIDDCENIRLEIARVSRTPAYLLLGQSSGFPSGEALKTAETPFLAKVRDRQISFGNVWEDVAALALAMGRDSPLPLSCLWRDPTPRNEKEHLESLAIKATLGVPDEQIMREMGDYTEEQISEWTLAKAERAATMAAAMQRATQQQGGATDGEGTPDEQARPGAVGAGASGGRRMR